MSVRPVFAAAILNGTKRWEFRRVRCKLATGDQIVIYATTPIQRIVGRFTVGDVRSGAPEELEALEQSPVLRPLLQAYLTGAVIVTAIEIVDPVRVQPTPISKMWPAMRAPRSYQYVSD